MPIWTKIAASSGSNAPIDPSGVAKVGMPLGRAGQAQDIANGVLFLASDASSYMIAKWEFSGTSYKNISIGNFD
jgi:NAD(P)-dependent dehydrogenase (short-subunit alcohol dehydrogenase family)